MNIKASAALFEAGAVRGGAIERVFLGGGWTVSFLRQSAAGEVRESLETSRGELRVFSSVESAVKALERVGFEVARLSL